MLPALVLAFRFASIDEGVAETARLLAPVMRRLLGGEQLHQFGVLCRPNKADQGAALAHQTDFVGAWAAYFEHDVSRGPQLGGTLDHIRTSGAVGVIAEVGQFTGTRFDRYRKAQLDEFLHHLGHGRHTFFARENLARNANALRGLGPRAGGRIDHFGRYASLHGATPLVVENEPVRELT